MPPAAIFVYEKNKYNNWKQEIERIDKAKL